MSRNLSFKNKRYETAYEKVLLKEQENLIEATLTKKHFISLAAIMKNSKTLDELKNKLYEWAKESNPAFDEDRFKKAAGMM